MGNLALIAERLIVEKILEIFAEATGKNRLYRNLAAAALFFTVVGLGFFVLAAYLWLRDNYQPDIAAAVAGLIAMGLALVMAVAMMIYVSRKQSIIRRIRLEIHETLREGMESLNEVIAEPVADNPKFAVLAASLIGYVAGEKIL